MQTNPKTPTQVDALIAQRLRELRTSKGLSLEALALQLDVCYQQLYKYEKQVNRIPLSRLVQICQIFQVNLDYFTQGILDDKPPVIGNEARQITTLARDIVKLPPKRRQAAANMIRALAEA